MTMNQTGEIEDDQENSHDVTQTDSQKEGYEKQWKYLRYCYWKYLQGISGWEYREFDIIVLHFIINNV